MSEEPLVKFHPSEVLHKINAIESLFPVQEWNINGRYFWPYLKVKLATSQNINKNNFKPKNKVGLFKKIENKIKFPLFLLQIFSVRDKLINADRLFISHEAYRLNFLNKKTNKFFDFNLNEPYLKSSNNIILEQLKGKKESYFNSNILIDFDQINKLHYLFTPIKKRQVLSINKYEDFYQYILDNFQYRDRLKSRFSIKAIEKELNIVNAKIDSYKKILKNSKIESAYFVCYYSLINFPLLCALNELGIKTVDIQHGGQGIGHYAYSSWGYLKGKKNNFLPRFFWVWDANSFEAINSWSKFNNFHKVIRNGNPWIYSCLKIGHPFKENADSSILINLIEVVLDSFIIETILYYGDKLQWRLRFHPRQIQNLGVLQEQLDSYKLNDFVKIENPIEIPLPISMLNAKAIISKGSGSIIEAVELGITPILLNSATADYYQKLIEEKKVIFVAETTSHELIKSINKYVLDVANNSKKIKELSYLDCYQEFEKILKKNDVPTP